MRPVPAFSSGAFSRGRPGEDTASQPVGARCMGRPGTGLGAFVPRAVLSAPVSRAAYGEMRHGIQWVFVAWGAPGRGLERFVLGMVLSAPVAGAAWEGHVVTMSGRLLHGAPRDGAWSVLYWGWCSQPPSRGRRGWSTLCWDEERRLPRASTILASLHLCISALEWIRLRQEAAL